MYGYSFESLCLCKNVQSGARAVQYSGCARSSTEGRRVGDADFLQRVVVEAISHSQLYSSWLAGHTAIGG